MPRQSLTMTARSGLSDAPKMLMSLVGASWRSPSAPPASGVSAMGATGALVATTVTSSIAPLGFELIARFTSRPVEMSCPFASVARLTLTRRPGPIAIGSGQF
jgi:hypothetical protein